MSNQKELIISHEIIDSLFKVLCKFSVTKPKEFEEIPAIPEDAEPEKADAMNVVIEEIKTNNTQIEMDNSRLEKMKHKISIVPRQNVEGFEPDQEVALVRMNNYREE